MQYWFVMPELPTPARSPARHAAAEELLLEQVRGFFTPGRAQAKGLHLWLY